MYDYLKGLLTYSCSGSKGYFATVEVNGIGYCVELTERDFIQLPENNSELKIYTVLIHKEDKMSLCGFLKREERDIFNILTSVSGVGLKMALTLINSFEIPTLIGLVLDGNYKELTRAKGVGPKLAQKIILELKDKLTNYGEAQNLQPAKKVVSSANSQNITDATQVLISLGYTQDEINEAMSKVFSRIDANTVSAEDILKETLKILSV